jgi:capsular polysaccharide biosynthesis protein
MELLGYLRIARRWWYLILLPALVVAAYGLASYRPPGVAYAGYVRYIVGQPAALAATSGYDPNYYRWLTSEYIATALKDWVRTGDFAAAVSARLAAEGLETPAGALPGVLIAENSRSLLIVTVTWGDASQVPAILNAATEALAENAAVFPQLGGLAAEVVPLDTPSPGPIAPSLRSRLDLPLKIALGLALGVGLALAAHYLDPFVRDRHELEQMGLGVVGEIPAGGGRGPARPTRRPPSARGVSGTDE